MEVVTSSDSAMEQKLIRLVEEYQTCLRRMCYALLRDEDEAQDAVQETFLKAYKAMAAFRGECNEKTWLMRIAINTCRDFRRSAWYRYLDRRITPEDLPLAASPEEEAHAELTAEIMRLPQRLQEVTLLHYYQNMTTREVAEALQIPQSTVSARLKRARLKLRTLLERGESV
ncbi:MAG: sigma-70 family RNA polymerase sigma factor [Clostridia bacterium]